MKKLGFIVLGLVVLLVIAAFVIPQFIDPNKYKPEIARQFKDKTGYDLDIKGSIKLTLLPVPKAYVGGILISNNGKTLVEVDEVSAYPKLMPLISGNVQVSSIKISKPRITLEKNEGGYSWQKAEAGSRKPETRNVQVGEKKPLDISINDITIENGEVNFSDEVAKKKYALSEINIKSAIGSLAGPVSFDAKLKYNGSPVSAKGSVENFTDPKITLDADFMDNKITFNGALSNGKFAAKSADIGPLGELLGIDAVKGYGKMPVDVAADVGYAKDNISLQNLKLAVGETSGSGNLSLKMDGQIDVTAALKFQKINLDQLLPKNGAPKAAKTDAEQMAEDTAPAKKVINADIDVTADEIVYGGALYKNLKVKATTEGQEVTLQPLAIDLPSGGKMQIYGVLSKDTKGRVFDGHVNMATNNLREILKSLKVDVASINDKGLKNFMADSDVVVTMRDRVRADLSKAVLKLDDSTFNGSAALDMASPLSVGVSGTIDKVDVTKYMKPQSVAEAKPKTAKGEANLSETRPLDFGWLQKFPVRMALNLAVGSIATADDVYGNIRLKLDASPGVLNVSQVTASSKKIQVAAKATIQSGAGQKPKLDVQANIGKINTADFIKTKAGSDSQAVNETKKQGKARWSTETIDLSVLKKLDLQFNANMTSLTHGQFVFDNLAVSGYINDGQLSLQNFSSGVFGGKITAKANVIGSAVPALSASFAGDNIDVARLAAAFSNNQRVQGKINLSSSFSTSGIHQLAMVSNLKGNVAIAANQMVVKGFDVDGFVKQITNISDPTALFGVARTISGDNAVTYLNNVNGAIACEAGMCRTQSGGIKIGTANSAGALDGYADLVNWKMDMNALFNLIIPGETSAKETPALGLHIYGALDEPKLDVNYDEIKRYLTGRGTKLLLKSGIVPDKYKSLLGGAAGAAAAPANDNAVAPVESGKKPKAGKLIKGALQNFLGGQ